MTFLLENFLHFLVAWMSNIVFAGLAYWLYRRTPRCAAASLRSPRETRNKKFSKRL